MYPVYTPKIIGFQMCLTAVWTKSLELLLLLKLGLLVLSVCLCLVVGIELTTVITRLLYH